MNPTLVSQFFLLSSDFIDSRPMTIPMSLLIDFHWYYFQVLVLLALVAASSGKPTVGVEPYMYFPCETQVREGDGLVVECPFYNIPELIRQAFTRNAPNNNLVSLHMHSDFEGTVLDYITDSGMLSGSYDTLKEFQLSYTPNPSFPKLLSKLTALEHLHLDHVPIEHVEAGYLKLGSPESLKVLSISNAPLYTFEAGAFPGMCDTFR